MARVITRFPVESLSAAAAGQSTVGGALPWMREAESRSTAGGHLATTPTLEGAKS